MSRFFVVVTGLALFLGARGLSAQDAAASGVSTSTTASEPLPAATATNDEPVVAGESPKEAAEAAQVPKSVPSEDLIAPASAVENLPEPMSTESSVKLVPDVTNFAADAPQPAASPAAATAGSAAVPAATITVPGGLNHGPVGLGNVAPVAASAPVVAKPEPVVLKEVAPEQKAALESQGIEANRTKLNTIILPNLNMHELKLTEALEAIHRLLTTPGAQTEDVNFVLKPGDYSHIMITLVMEKPTLGQALEELAKQANLKVVPEEYAIALIGDGTPKS